MILVQVEVPSQSYNSPQEIFNCIHIFAIGSSQNNYYYYLLNNLKKVFEVQTAGFQSFLDDLFTAAVVHLDHLVFLTA